MAISNVSNLTPQQTWRHLSHEARHDFHALGKALANGDLTSAQQVFASLQQLQSTLPSDVSTTSSSSAVPATGQTDTSTTSGTNNVDQLLAMLEHANNANLNSTLNTGNTALLNTFSNGMSTLGQDLQSGNLTQAQQDFTQVQQTVRTAGASSAFQAKPQHQASHAQNSTQPGASTVANSSSTSS